MAEAPIGMGVRAIPFGIQLTMNSPRRRDRVPQSGICGPGKLRTRGVYPEFSGPERALTTPARSLELPRIFIPFNCRPANPTIRRTRWKHCGQGYYVWGRGCSSAIDATDHVSGMDTALANPGNLEEPLLIPCGVDGERDSEAMG